MRKYEHLKMILERMIHTISVRELVCKPRKSLMVIKKQNVDKRTQTDKALKIWKEHFENHLNTEFPHDKSILQSIPETMPGTEQSTEELIK